MLTTRRYEDVTVGEGLPELRIPLTRTMIVATAIASRDYQDVHHDPSLAVERGSRDIFMNILTTNGLVDRYVTGWAGPAAVVKAIRIRLGAPNYPGDTMVLTGTVTAKHDDRRVEVAVKGVNEIGPHVTGTVVVRLPAREGDGS
ncbi:MAG TPA: MaoC family dehydratase [Spirillospora sp.]